MVYTSATLTHTHARTHAHTHTHTHTHARTHAHTHTHTHACTHACTHTHTHTHAHTHTRAHTHTHTHTQLMTSIKAVLIEMLSTFEAKGKMGAKQLKEQLHTAWPIPDSTVALAHLRKELVNDMKQSLEVVRSVCVASFPGRSRLPSSLLGPISSILSYPLLPSPTLTTHPLTPLTLPSSYPYPPSSPTLTGTCLLRAGATAGGE